MGGHHRPQDAFQELRGRDTSRMRAGQRRAGRAEHGACAGDGHFQLYLGVCHAGAAVCQDLQLIFVSFCMCAVKTARQPWEDKGSWGSGHERTVEGRVAETRDGCREFSAPLYLRFHEVGA